MEPSSAGIQSRTRESSRAGKSGRRSAQAAGLGQGRAPRRRSRAPLDRETSAGEDAEHSARADRDQIELGLARGDDQQDQGAGAGRGRGTGARAGTKRWPWAGSQGSSELERKRKEAAAQGKTGIGPRARRAGGQAPREPEAAPEELRTHREEGWRPGAVRLGASGRAARGRKKQRGQRWEIRPGWESDGRVAGAQRTGGGSAGSRRKTTRAGIRNHVQRCDFFFPQAAAGEDKRVGEKSSAAVARFSSLRERTRMTAGKIRQRREKKISTGRAR
jgi:hypothetical protein